MRTYYRVTDQGTPGSLRRKEKEIKKLGGEIECMVNLEKRRYLEEKYPQHQYKFDTLEEAWEKEKEIAANDHFAYINKVTESYTDEV